ncbi:MAG: hypothetical protein KJ072_11415 [Verrucomicrobia bacterium]|nr:hypothetical protein [Verrucomicrobiota bacterium]
MKTRRAARNRRRLRLVFGWMLILTLAVGEFWMLGQFAQGIGRLPGTSPGQDTPPTADLAMVIR